MADFDSVVCPKCKVGFAPGIAVCPFCEIPLVSEKEFEDEPGEIPEPIILDDDISSLKELRTADVGWIHHLQDKLAEAGIPHCIEQSQPRRMVFSVYVRPKDLDRQKILMRKSLQKRFRMANECSTQRIWISRLALVVATDLAKTTLSAVATA